MKFTANKNDLLALIPLVCTDASRIAFSGVLFEVKNKVLRLVATNGRAMGILTLGNSECEDGEFIADTSMVKYLQPRKSKYGKPSQIVVVDKSDAEVRFSMAGSVISEVIDSKYPSWRQVVPHTEMDHGCDLDVAFKYLKSFALVAQALTKTDIIHVRKHKPTSENSTFTPYSIWTTDPRFYGILMPTMAPACVIPTFN